MDLKHFIEFRTPSPVNSISHPLYDSYGLKVSIKRDDLIHEKISGNKWRKLKQNIAVAQQYNYKGIISFGGAYSNHLHACAYACQIFGLKLIAVIRSKYADYNNPTLKDIRATGAELVFIDNEDYRRKEQDDFLNQLEDDYPGYFIIPEGGKNNLGMKGVEEIIEELEDIPDHIIIGAGTASTAVGLAHALEAYPNTCLHVIACVKDSSNLNFIKSQITNPDQLIYYENFTHGGFAKVNDELINFINSYWEETSIPLDPIYNGKVIMAFHQLVENQVFNSDEKIMLVHTGGLQGLRGHNLRYGNRPNLQIRFANRIHY